MARQSVIPASAFVIGLIRKTGTARPALETNWLPRQMMENTIGRWRILSPVNKSAGRKKRRNRRKQSRPKVKEPSSPSRSFLIAFSVSIMIGETPISYPLAYSGSKQRLYPEVTLPTQEKKQAHHRGTVRQHKSGTGSGNWSNRRQVSQPWRLKCDQIEQDLSRQRCQIEPAVQKKISSQSG